jgi:hypothetical protein
VDEATPIAAQAATEELRADFAKLAPLAATIPKWCSADHPIGRAYQAAQYVLDVAFPRGHGAGLVPAAHRIKEAVDAVLAERDAHRRCGYPDAPTDAYLLRALWIERHSLRKIAKEIGRDEKTIRGRVGAALDALTATLPDISRQYGPPHFAILSEKWTPISRKSFQNRPKPQPRTVETKMAWPSSRAEVAAMVDDYLAAGGEVQKAPTGLTRDHREARRVFRGGWDAIRDPSFTLGEQRHLHQYRSKRNTDYPPRQKGRPAPTQTRGVPAKKLPRTIKDLKRIGNAKSHSEEVWLALFGFGGFDEARAKEDKENRELVEEFLDPETRERRAELEPAFREQSGRGKRMRALLTVEFLKLKQGEIRRRGIIERGCRRMAWVKQVTERRRAPKPIKQPTRKQQELECQADAILKEGKK